MYIYIWYCLLPFAIERGAGTSPGRCTRPLVPPCDLVHFQQFLRLASDPSKAQDRHWKIETNARKPIDILEIISNIKTILDFTKCLPDLIYWVGFGTAMRFITRKQHMEFVSFRLLLCFSRKYVINTTCNKQDYLLCNAY